MAGLPTVHACAVLVGARALLIRGPAGSGKSLLTFNLIAAAQSGLLPFARLVGDDRIRLEPCHGRLLVRAPAALAGLIEVRGLGIRRLTYEPVAVVGGVIDLAAADAKRLSEQAEIEVEGIKLSQLKIAQGHDPYPSVLAWLTSRSADEALVAEK
jgi:serine kinase of HPr protein (carbohydrate metabolism regulator)